MMQRLHDNIRGWFAWTIVIIISATFALFGLHSYLDVRSNKTNIATVNGVEISRRDLDTAYQQLRRNAMIQQRTTSLPAAVDKIYKKQALNQLINNQVLTDAARSAGFVVSREQAEAELMNFSAFQQDGKFSPELFERVMRYSVTSPQMFVATLRDDILINQLQAGIMSSSFSIPKELDNAVSLMAQTRDVDYMLLDSEKFLKDVKVTDNQIKTFYEKHKQAFAIPEKIRIDYVRVNVKDIMDSVKVDDGELKTYYEDNKANYRTPARWKVSQILLTVPENADKKTLEAIQNKAKQLKQRIDKGEDFASIATAQSQDVISKKKGGAMPWITAGSFDPQFEKMLLTLKPGDVSNPVQTKFGINIIKLEKFEPTAYKPFAEVKDVIKKNLISERGQKRFAELSEELSNLAFVNPESLNELAKTANVKALTSDWFSRKGGSDDITKNPRIIQAAFSSEVLDEGNNSEVITLDDQNIVVLRLKTHKTASIQPLKSVRQKIESTLKARKAYALARDTAEKIMSSEQKGESVKALQEQYALQWKTLDNIKRTDVTISPQLVLASFEIPRPTASVKKPAKLVNLDDNVIAIVKLKDVHTGSDKDLSKLQETIVKRMVATTQGAWEFRLYVNDLMQKADIVRFDR